MDEIISKILQMDETARKIDEEAQAERIASQEEVRYTRNTLKAQRNTLKLIRRRRKRLLTLSGKKAKSISAMFPRSLTENSAPIKINGSMTLSTEC